MRIIDFRSDKITKLTEEMRQAGILASSFGDKKIRFVTNYQISREDIEYTIKKVHKIIT